MENEMIVSLKVSELKELLKKTLNESFAENSALFSPKKENCNNEAYLSKRQVVEQYGAAFAFSESNVARLTQSGELSSRKIGRRRVYLKTEIEGFIDSKKKPTKSDLNFQVDQFLSTGKRQSA